MTATLTPPAPTEALPAPNALASALADPHLAFAADVLDDIERVRIANAHRLRIMTLDADALDEDGVSRGFGLPSDAPQVASLTMIMRSLHCGANAPAERRRGCCLEHTAELDLRARLRAHPLAGWVAQAKGVGDKQGARLLAAIGDPYWNTLHDRPRLVSELWSYCGMGNAAKQVRVRGQRANWSATAKMRTYLVSVSIVKAGGPYREVYDAARMKYAGAVHERECRRCGPAGRPAAAGSPISDGHAHGRALRAVGKEVLRDLWLAARDIHKGSA